MRRWLRPSGYCCVCNKRVSLNIHGGATQHSVKRGVGTCPGSERGMNLTPHIKRWFAGWINTPCPNCLRRFEVGGNWFIRRRRAALHRDHWKVCTA